MSSAVISTSAALGRPFLFDDEPAPEVGSISAIGRASEKIHVGTAALGCPVEQSSTATSPAHAFPGVAGQAKRPAGSQLQAITDIFQSKIGNRQSAIPLAPASRLAVGPAPEMASSGLAALDSLTGGLPRGCLTEICGPASSGRTSVLLAALAAATRRGEYCTLIDASDALDPHSIAAAGVDLDRLLWVRCGEDSPRKHKPNQQGSPVSRASSAREVGNFEQPA